MNKRNLLYIGHPYHLKSRSADFMHKALNREFNIDFVEAEVDCTFDLAKLDKFKGKKYDVCLCWQVMPPLSEIKSCVSYDHGVFFPMADYYYGMLPVGMPIWEQYRDVKIFSFSRRLHEELVGKGYDSTYLQYFPKPAEIQEWGDPYSVYFWQRITHLNVYNILGVLKLFPIRHLHLHKAVDPGHQQVLLPLGCQADYAVTYSTWYETRERMYEDMDRCAIYFAPREFEGIGLGYLEAMAHGRCVFAHDETTANEYIEHGVNGYLYDYRHPQSISLTQEDVRRVQKTAHAFVSKGYRKWLAVEATLPSMMLSPAKPNRAKFCTSLVLSVNDPRKPLADPVGYRAQQSKEMSLRSVQCEAKDRYECVRELRVFGLPVARKYRRRDGLVYHWKVAGMPIITAEVV